LRSVNKVASLPLSDAEKYFFNSLQKGITVNRQTLYNYVLSALPLALLVLDKNEKIIFSSKSFYTLLNKLEKEVENGTGKRITLYDELRRCIEQVQKEGGRKEAELHIEHTAGYGSVLRAIVSKLSFAPKAHRPLAHSEEHAGSDWKSSSRRDGSPEGVLTDIASGKDNPSLLTSRESCSGDEPEPSILLILEDITDKIRMEEQLIQSEKSAGMGQLAASIAHELGNPLNAITAILQEIKPLLQKKEVEVSGGIDAVLDNLKAMDELLRDLINFTAPRERGLRHTDIQKAISQVLVLVSSQAARQHIEIRDDFLGDIPECWMDVRQMKQVFLNLFKNAIEAMPKGGVLSVRTRLLRKDEVGISRSAESFEKDSIVIEVSDTGAGIPEDELNVIFKPFYTTKESGTGLGLSICRTIIEEHFGSIKVKSSLGKGSTFTLSLPMDGDDHGQV
jgi:signal transduction histidine kinase